MFKILLKYQFRNKQAYIFIPMLTLFIIRQFDKNMGFSNPYLFGFVYSSFMFTNLIFYSKIPISLLFITDARMVSFVRSYNICLLIWMNLTEAVIVGYNTWSSKVPLFTSLRGVLILNTILFLAFIIGNRISFSDLFTMKNRNWAVLGAAFLFIVIVLPMGCLLAFLDYKRPQTFYITAGLLLAFITTWWLDSKRYKQIIFSSHFLGL